jgi:catechol 2,3-dioxygenase-like lactoylglutathione lyase family enzyme
MLGLQKWEDEMSTGEFRFVFFANDYESTLTFYRDGLELPIIGGWDRGPDDRGTLFQAASGIIEVIHPHGRELVPPQGAWLLFQVDNVDDWYQHVRTKGLRILQELTNQPWGHREFKLTVRMPASVRPLNSSTVLDYS